MLPSTTHPQIRYNQFISFRDCLSYGFIAMGFVFGAFGHTCAFVRMNSHLHVNPQLVPANCRCELIRTGEFRMPVGFVFCASGHSHAFVRMNSHLHVNPEPVPINCRCELIRTDEFCMPVRFVFGAFGHICASVRMNSHLHVIFATYM